MRNPYDAYVVSNPRGTPILVTLTRIGADKAVAMSPGCSYVKVPCAHASYRVDDALTEAA